MSWRVGFVPKPGPMLEQHLFTRLRQIVDEYIGKQTAYGEQGVYQFARMAGTRALDWYPELADPETCRRAEEL